MGNLDFILSTINWILIAIGVVSLLYFARIDDSRREHFLGWQADKDGNVKELKKGWVQEYGKKIFRNRD